MITFSLKNIAHRQNSDLYCSFFNNTVKARQPPILTSLFHFKSVQRIRFAENILLHNSIIMNKGRPDVNLPQSICKICALNFTTIELVKDPRLEEPN